jgi:hypothetical protein
MVKSVLGDACAYIPGPRQGDKARYYKIGLAMRDGDRISIKIDTLPLPGMGWSGWINIFPSERQPRPTDLRDRAVGTSIPGKSPGTSGFDNFEDEIPF